MGQKKDIGLVFEEKLKVGTKTPNENLWDKIDTTLDEKNRKSKRFFYIWFIGGTLVLLTGVYLFFGNKIFTNSETQSNQSTYTNTTPTSISTLSKEKNEATFTANHKDSSALKNNTEKLLKTDTTDKPNVKTELANPQQTPQLKYQNEPRVKSKKRNSNKTNLEEVYDVSTNYHYYNSEDNEQIITKDKNMIDSIIKSKSHHIDSVKTPIDTLK